MSPRILLVVAGVAVIGCDRPTAPIPPAQHVPGSASLTKAGTTKSNEFIDVSGTVASPCNGDVVFLSGREHIVQTTTTDGTTSTIKLHINFDDLQGETADGVKYHLNAAAKQTFVQEVAGPTYSIETLLNEELISQGSAPNWIAHITETVNYDGTTYSVTITRWDVECRG